MPLTEVLPDTPGYYMFDDFKAYHCLAAFSSGKQDLGFQNNPNLRKNRSQFLQKLAIPSRELVCLQQVHGNNVFVATKKDKGHGAYDYALAIPGYEGIITAEPQLPLAVFTADCLSVFMLDTEKRVAAVLHSGWRGTRDNIVGVTLDIMSSKFSSRVENIICGLGPGIRSCCYEVGTEFKGYFSQGLLKRKGKIFLDLARTNLSQLRGAGIKPEHLYDCGICTCCRRDFFSYRRDGQAAGRMMSVIMLE